MSNMVANQHNDNTTTLHDDSNKILSAEELKEIENLVDSIIIDDEFEEAIDSLSKLFTTEVSDDDPGLIYDILPYQETFFEDNILRSHGETLKNNVLVGDQGHAPELPSPATQLPSPAVLPYQETSFKDNIQRSYGETFQNNVLVGDQGHAPELPTPATQLLSPHVLPYQETSFKHNIQRSNAETTFEDFVVVGDQGLALGLPTHTTQLYPHGFAFTHVPTPPTVLPATHVYAISPNTTLSKHVESGWVQTFNYSNHSTPHILKSHRKRYERWTEDEHRLFLIGLEHCGVGDWKGISKWYLPSKSSTQIASHAQKYMLHQKAPKKDKKRRSIHDVTSKDINTVVVPGYIVQEQGLPPTPNFTIQPQEMQVSQHNHLYNTYYQTGGCSSQEGFFNWNNQI